MLTRTKRFFSVQELVDLYKAHVLSFVEFRTAAIYHVCDTYLRRLDACQTSFLKEIGLTEETALLEFNLAPLNVRRDVAMLGVLHRTVLGQGPEPLRHLFQADMSVSTRHTRSSENKHDRQLVDMRNQHFLKITRRSAFGLVAVYNKLPQRIVSQETVRVFQSHLQLLVKKQCSLQDVRWTELLSPRVPMYRHPLRSI